MDVESLRTKPEGFRRCHEEEGTRREKGTILKPDECFKERATIEGEVINKF